MNFHRYQFKINFSYEHMKWNLKKMIFQHQFLQQQIHKEYLNNHAKPIQILFIMYQQLIKFVIGQKIY